MTIAKGDYIGGRFVEPSGAALTSHNPARMLEPVFSTRADPARARAACEKAAEAALGWAALSMSARREVLHRFRAALADAEEALAEAITLEMGKIRSEARAEVQALLARFALVEDQVEKDLRSGRLTGHPGEALHYHPHGVVAVLGPFNFPLHLCHAHVVPALLLGNCVVVKPSDVTPLCGQRYAEAAHAAGFPAGVFNLVQGGGAVGAALVEHEAVHGLAFTGSWATGRRIAEAALDRPEMLVALEMGGKNTCVVLDDADIRQAAHEIVIGGYLTTGQRCTCTDLVMVHTRRMEALSQALLAVLRELTFGDPDEPASFAGPLATDAGRIRYLEALRRAREGGAEVLLEGGEKPGGAYVLPSLHRLQPGVPGIPGYTDEELFGPDLCLIPIADEAEAIERLEALPYGFATSVFTQERARFDVFLWEVRTGLLNLNRGTNKASPRLPFLGVKRSGNFRPAGGWAARNLVYPVAELENAGTGFDAHPKVAPHLPPTDLGELEARHGAEEEAEARQSLLDRPRPMSVRLPLGGRLPQSSTWLERYYAGRRFVREKKPPVFDHLRSCGPYLVSVDDEPLSVLDAMSQTATFPAGFAPDEVVRAYVGGAFTDAALLPSDTSLPGVPEAEAFAAWLREKLPALPTVSFVNSGAEANEKAYALCRLAAGAEAVGHGRDRLLAFEGSFHGRTLLALYASWNPQKRIPFQIAGYEVDFVELPLFDPSRGEPSDPPFWRSLCASGDREALLAQAAEEHDPLLRSELAVLARVVEVLEQQRTFAVDIEPMQSEGGDRYASARFFRGLRLVTRACAVPLILDEVQTGFGLGGTFAWHERFALIDADGRPDHPDCVTFAKRAQVGICMSVFPDPEPGCTSTAALLRGRIYAASVGDGADAERIEALVRPRLAEIERRWGHRIELPRATGYAFAFDLRCADDLPAYIAQRFFRGAIVFPAGSRTVRYRLNASFDEASVDTLFEAVQRSLSWVEAHPGTRPPAWLDLPRPTPPSRAGKAAVPASVALRIARPDEAAVLLPRIVELERETYEPARRDSRDKLALAFEDGGVVVVAEAPGSSDVVPGDMPGAVPGDVLGEDADSAPRRLVGVALGCPLERMGDLPGPARDPELGRRSTLYAQAVTVHPDHAGQGIGRALKVRLLRAARDLRDAEGRPRYQHVSGRNRLPDAGAMSRLNDSLGAYTLDVLDGQYGGSAKARYYRMPLGRFLPAPASAPPVAAGEHGAEQRSAGRLASRLRIDLAGGLVRPLTAPPPTLRQRWEDGSLFGPAVHRITLLNYITPAVVRATEWVASLLPRLPHLYLTSGRDETVDKSLRILRWHRPRGEVAVGLLGGYVGHTTAAARSLSDPAVHRQGPPHFAWPRVPHPAEVGTARTIQSLHTLTREVGAERLLGLYIEPLQERTGRTIPPDFWAELHAFRASSGVPVVFVESASAHYRSGAAPFLGSAAPFDPDAQIWWGGGAVGFVHVSTPLLVDKPMTMVSTWDGDELSLIQVHHQLRAVRSLSLSATCAAFGEALSSARAGGFSVRGAGLYRVIAAGERGPALVASLAEEGIRARCLPGGFVPMVPPLDAPPETLEALGDVLTRILS